MIEINLIPVHLRKKESKASEALVFLNLPKEFVLGCSALFIVVLLSIHGVLLFIALGKSNESKDTQEEWKRMARDKSELDSVTKELKELKSKITLIKDNATKKILIWSQKLNILSDMLPKGVWLRKVAYSNNTMTIQGNAYSKAHDEITVLGNFVSILKKDSDFMKDFSTLELNSITRVKRGDIEIADFLITAKTKESLNLETPKAKTK